jgi:multidrug efflux pump subunit AcrB
MNVSAWSIRNPIPAILLFVMLTLLGVMAFKAMKIQQFMDIDLPMVTVTASLPGAAPAQMETEVARKIENSVATLQGIKHIYTKVQDGDGHGHHRVPSRKADAGGGRRRPRRRLAHPLRPARATSATR